MSATAVKFQRLGRWDLEQLPQPEQQAVREAIDSVLSLPPGQWPAHRVRLLSAEKSLYLLNATPEWRVFFTLAPSGRIEITQVAHAETIRWLAERWRESNGRNEASCLPCP